MGTKSGGRIAKFPGPGRKLLSGEAVVRNKKGEGQTLGAAPGISSRLATKKNTSKEKDAKLKDSAVKSKATTVKKKSSSKQSSDVGVKKEKEVIVLD